MSKTYMMPGEELTPEDRKNIKDFEDKQAQEQKERLEEQVKKEKERKMVTLEELFKTRISPKDDRVLVYPDPVQTVTDSGIIKPDEVIKQERPLTGTVIAVGPGKANDMLTNKLLLAILGRLQKSDEVLSFEQFEKLTQEVDRKQIPYHVGDRVLYGRFAGTTTEDPDTKTPLLIMRPTDIFATI